MRALFVRVVVAVTSWRAVRWLFTRTRIGRRVALRFVAGEALDDAVRVARGLNDAGMSVSLDHLGEHVTDAASATAARDAYLACLDRIAADGLDANISVKLTQLGLGLDEGLCADNLQALARRAAGLGLTVTIDMEESNHTGATLRLYETVGRVHGNLGVAIQAYLHRTPADLDHIIPLGGHIRLCKGAYDEGVAVALQSRVDIDSAYDRLLGRLMEASETMPAVATHDGARIARALDLAVMRAGPFEFQMLFGVRTRLQQELVEAGHPMRVYLPYGDSWYPYLTRRLAERPANVWFFVRALFGR
ncbi:MAG TPA: proline dehydrogenase family protein [Acidimicrobiia bacterium]